MMNDDHHNNNHYDNNNHDNNKNNNSKKKKIKLTNHGNVRTNNETCPIVIDDDEDEECITKKSSNSDAEGQDDSQQQQQQQQQTAWEDTPKDKKQCEIPLQNSNEDDIHQEGGETSNSNDIHSLKNVQPIKEQADPEEEEEHRNNNHNSRSTNNAMKPGEVTCRRLIQEALYELEQDAFRGMGRYDPCYSLETMESENQKCDESSKNIVVNGTISIDERHHSGRRIRPSPWELSCGPFPIQQQQQQWPNDSKNSISSNDFSNSWYNQCPTLIQWSYRRGKRKKSKVEEDIIIGQRGPEPEIRCRCDANPFCLATLGGVMNQVLVRDWKRQQQNQNQQQNKEELRQSSTPDVATNGKPSNGDSGEEGEVVEILDNSEIPQVRPQTQEKFKKIRRSTWVDVDRIRSYWGTIGTSLRSREEYIHLLRKHHQQLIFDNPVQETITKPNQLKISIPPGIQNLGATCYLNTQLQCLAQNTVFVEGIFSWKPPQQKEKHNRMTSVMKLFQDLLGSMKAGPLATTNALQFSDALGLDHFEQQDPNEFSRLFFERMHESFKNSAADNEQGNNRNDQQYDLAKLLPRLFQGVIRYETTCLHDKCKAVSTRFEEFMDINLAITKPEEIKTKKGGQQQTLLDLFFSDTFADVDVQSCWTRYCMDETLSGENQYFCSACERKRDAVRRLYFQKLPPVLNVQLSRYIFDLAAQSKKKLMDCVLLPRLLTAREGKKSDSPKAAETTSQKQYILCAVMRHQGKSAYSGHYIAEAMDWITGEWFEFNDEKVSLLETGPSNSFTPSISLDPKKLPQGSQDAYNLYYVEKEFLRQSVFEFFHNRKETNVLEEMAIERSNVYAELTQRCLEDRIVLNRMLRRRELILEKMFPLDFYCNPTFVSLDTKYVFVDGEFLRRFLSCESSWDEELSNRSLSCCPQRCEHGKLHPRVARLGKLIPLPMFEAMVDILRQETQEETASQQIFDDLGLPCHGLFCSTCEREYRAELEPKLHDLQELLYLYEKLDPKEDESDSTNSQSDSSGEDAVATSFLVSRKFITAFRNEVVRLMKKTIGANLTGPPDILLLSNEGKFPGEGLDAIDLQLSLSSDSKGGDIDIRINSAITCEHGNCVNNISKRNVRYVSASLWNRLKAFFPRAIEHPYVNESRVGCTQCKSNNLVVDSLSSKLQGLAKKFRTLNTGLSCMEILESGSVCPSFRVVQSSDLAALRNFCAHFRKSNNSAKWMSADSIKEKLQQIFRGKFIPLGHVESGDLFGPFNCKTHAKPIKNALVTLADNLHPIPSLKDGLALLDESDYEEYMTQLFEIAMIYGKANQKDLTLDELDLDVDDTRALADAAFRNSNMSGFHPTVESLARLGTGDDLSVFCIESKEVTLFMSVKGGLCVDPQCSADFDLGMRENMASVDSKTDGTDDTSRDLGASGNGKNETITIDWEEDGTTQNRKILGLALVEVDEEVSDERIIESLSQSCGMPSGGAAENRFVRRSTRRRKTRLPIGVIRSEEMVRFDITSNIAALRLCLMESCQQGSQFSLSHCIKLVVWPKAKEVPMLIDQNENATLEVNSRGPPITIALPFSMNQNRFIDVCEEKLSMKCSVADLKNHVFLVRNTEKDPTAGDIPEENLLDHLITLSSDCVGGKDGKNGKRKKPAPEKGFTGTFLSSTKNSDVLDVGDTTVVAVPKQVNSPVKIVLEEDVVYSCNGGNLPKRARFAEGAEIIDSVAIVGIPDDNISHPGENIQDRTDLALTSKTDRLNNRSDRLAGLAKAALLSSSARIASSNYGELAVELAGLLVASCDTKEEHQSFCMDAASWAVAMNPGEKDANSLLDQALAKYFELSSVD